MRGWRLRLPKGDVGICRPNPYSQRGWGGNTGARHRAAQKKVAAMKIHVDIDCTPEEARVFLGLPDVGPLQEALMAELQSRMMANLQVMEPEQLFKTWLPAGLQGWEQLQKAFWSQKIGRAHV